MAEYLLDEADVGTVLEHDRPSGERQRILDVLDSLLRDAQARIAYAKPG